MTAVAELPRAGDPAPPWIGERPCILPPPRRGAAVGIGAVRDAPASPRARPHGGVHSRITPASIGAAPIIRDGELPREALWRSRFRQSLRTRSVFVLGMLPFVLADGLGAGFLVSWQRLIALQLLVLGVNAAAWALDRRDRVRLWHFWAVIAFDFLAIGGLAVAVAPCGYLALPFLAVAVGRYALGQPVAGRVGLGLAVFVYAAARALGLRLAHGSLGAMRGAQPVVVVGVELAALAAVGLVALWGPQAYTRRVARVRRALTALGGGALATRLATDDMDDLRPLAESFNRTAEALDATTTALCASEARHRAIFDHAAVGILLLGADGVICETNPACQRLLGYGADALRGTAAEWLCPAEDATLWREALRAVTVEDVAEAMAPAAVHAARDGASPAGVMRGDTTLELRYRRCDGVVRWGALTLSRAPAASGAAVIAMVQDVTERKRLEAELERRASQDPLTGLANRAGLAAAMRDAPRAAILAVDLDGFKAVNDTHGHAAGDRLLQAVAARLLDATRGSDLVARLGGDEFVVLLRQARGPDEVRLVAARIVAALGAPYPLGSSCAGDGAGPTARIGASVGGALADDAPAGHGADAADPPQGDGRADGHAAALLRDADRALYQAKALGRGRAVLFGTRGS